MATKSKLQKFSVTFHVVADLSVDVMALDIEGAISSARETSPYDIISNYDEIIDASADVMSVWTAAD